MGKGTGCFNCRHHCNGRITPPGWSYDCKKGLDNTNIKTLEDVLKCPLGKPQIGFQIGGYYTHMYFKKDGDCLEWIIESDGDFPIHGNEKLPIRFHVCDFTQIEQFVLFWGKYLREKGMLKSDNEKWM